MRLSTEIYEIGIGHCKKISSAGNAGNGFRYVWHDIARRYFNLECFPDNNEELQYLIWNAGNEHPLSDAEKIVLASTMDRVIVSSHDKPRLLAAFREYASNHPNSSFLEQVSLIALADIKLGNKIAWLQHSWSEFYFSPDYDENDIPTYHDLSGAWDLFEQFDELKAGDFNS
jgi:hypothetical protein